MANEQRDRGAPGLRMLELETTTTRGVATSAGGGVELGSRKRIGRRAFDACCFALAFAADDHEATAAAGAARHARRAGVALRDAAQREGWERRDQRKQESEEADAHGLARFERRPVTQRRACQPYFGQREEKPRVGCAAVASWLLVEMAMPAMNMAMLAVAADFEA